MTSSLRGWLPWCKSTRYAYLEPLADDSEDDKSSGRVLQPHSNKRRHQRPGYVVLCSSLLLNGVLVLSCGLLFARSRPLEQPHDPFNNTLIRQVSMPSPILDQLHIPLSTVRRNGSLLPNHPPSIYRQDPSDEVDKAWNRLANINPIPISGQDVRNIGYDPRQVAEWPAVYGLGDDAYVARLDVFHEIHCLDMLRKEVHFEHYYAAEKGWHKPGDASADHKVHISHCIYALLQSLMCSANTDPFIHFWVDVGDEPYPDFSINRQCRDFESVLAWQQKNSIPMSKFRDVIRKPEGASPRIMSLEYKYMVGLIEDDPEKIKEALDETAKLGNA